MSKALSQDLRVRVLTAIAGGLPCRQAALRFGVSAASAIRWRALERRQGDARPKVLGGDRRSGRIEAQTGFILGLVEATPDITLAEIRSELAAKGVGVGMATLCASSIGARSRSKKGGACHRAGPSGRPEAAPGLVRSPARPRSKPPRMHRRDLDLHRHGPQERARSQGPAASRRRSAWPLEDDDPRGRIGDRRHRSAVRCRRTHQQARLRDLRRQGAGARVAARRHRRGEQPVQPQRAGGTRHDRGRRSQAALPAARTRPTSIRSRTPSPS